MPTATPGNCNMALPRKDRSATIISAMQKIRTVCQRQILRAARNPCSSRRIGDATKAPRRSVRVQMCRSAVPAPLLAVPVCVKGRDTCRLCSPALLAAATLILAQGHGRRSRDQSARAGNSARRPPRPRRVRHRRRHARLDRPLSPRTCPAAAAGSRARHGPARPAARPREGGAVRRLHGRRLERATQGRRKADRQDVSDAARRSRRADPGGGLFRLAGLERHHDAPTGRAHARPAGAVAQASLRQTRASARGSARFRRRDARHALGLLSGDRPHRADRAHDGCPPVVEGQKGRHAPDRRRRRQMDAGHQRLARQGPARHLAPRAARANPRTCRSRCAK